MHNLNVPKSRSVLLQLFFFFFSPTKADSVPHTGPNSIPFASITITLPCRSQRIAQGNEALNKRPDSLQEVMTWLPTIKLKREHWNWQRLKRKCFYWKPQWMGITTIAMKIITKCKSLKNNFDLLETDKLRPMCLLVWSSSRKHPENFIAKELPAALTTQKCLRTMQANYHLTKLKKCRFL